MLEEEIEMMKENEKISLQMKALFGSKQNSEEQQITYKNKLIQLYSIAVQNISELPTT